MRVVRATASQHPAPTPTAVDSQHRRRSACLWYLPRVLVAHDPAPLRDTDDGVDVTLIRWMLSLSPEERLAVLQGFTDSVAELTHDSPSTKVQRSA